MVKRYLLFGHEEFPSAKPIDCVLEDGFDTIDGAVLWAKSFPKKFMVVMDRYNPGMMVWDNFVV
jgi:hypothetical protein